MSTPKVSVIMPSLNVAPYIQECIESAVNQTLRDIEIICVDAGSTDGTWEMLQRYARKDSRITVIRSDKKSYGHQMNLGFDAAKGEYLAILETDDYIQPTMYEDMYTLAKRNHLDLIKADHTVFVGDPSARFYTYKEIAARKLYDRVLNPRENMDLFNAQMQTWSGIYNMEFLRRHNIRHNETPGASYQDNGFWFQTFMHAGRIMFVHKDYYHLRRDNPNSSVNNKGKVFCIFEEYAFIESLMRSSEELEKLYAPIFQKKKFDNCIFHYGRIAPEFKLEFLERLSREYGSARDAGELVPELYEAEKFRDLQLIIDRPRLYHALHRKDIDRSALPAEERALVLEHELMLAEQELEALRAGSDYKIGRKLTMIPRLCSGLVCCYRENGFRRTVRQILVHMHILKTEEQEVQRHEQFWANLPREQYDREVSEWVKSFTGKDLNLKNPVTFNEKMNWLKLYGRTPLWSKCACKYEAREYASERIGEQFLIPLLGVWDNANDIDFDTLPDRFVFKATHGCKWNIVVRDKAQLDVLETRIRLNHWLSREYGFTDGLQLHYNGIKPRIIAEEYLENRDGVLCDYKVWCFNGRAEFVQFIAERQNGTKMVFFDREWNRQSFISNDQRYEGDVPKPERLEELLHAAEQLAEPFPFARVDFYVLNDGSLKFGEVTLSPAGGHMVFSPAKYDRILGDMLDISGLTRNKQQ